MEDPLLDSLLRAVASAPDDVPLRLHVATVLLDKGQPELALEHCSAVLARQPRHPEGLALLGQATAALTEAGPPAAPAGPPRPPRAARPAGAARRPARPGRTGRLRACSAGAQAGLGLRLGRRRGTGGR